MLNLNLAAVTRGPVRVRGEIPPDHPLWQDADVNLLQPIEVDLQAQPVGEGVLVRGSLHTTLEMKCRRCLSRVEREVDDTVDLLFEPLKAEEEGVSEEIYPLPERGSELDLLEPLREQLILRLPEYVVCREECRGLCPQCGADLNETTCDCVPESAASPWDALKNLKFD